MTLNMVANNLNQSINISSNLTRKYRHESAPMTAAHILLSLTQDGKSIEQVAKKDFDSNLELVHVWADYIVGVNWMQKNNDVGRKYEWMATDNGKKWVLKIINRYLHDDK